MNRRIALLALSLLILIAAASAIYLRNDDAPLEPAPTAAAAAAPAVALKIGMVSVSQQMLLYKALSSRVEHGKIKAESVALHLATESGLEAAGLSREDLAKLRERTARPSRKTLLAALRSEELDCACLPAVQVLSETAAGTLNPMAVIQLGHAEEESAALQLLLRAGLEAPADTSGLRAAAGGPAAQLLLSRLLGRAVETRPDLAAGLEAGELDLVLGGGGELKALVEAGGAHRWRPLTLEEREVSVDLLVCNFVAMRERGRLGVLADVARGYRSYLSRKGDEESLVYRFGYSPSGRVESDRLQAMADEMAALGLLAKAPLVLELQAGSGARQLDAVRERLDVLKVENSLLGGGIKEPDGGAGEKSERSHQ